MDTYVHKKVTVTLKPGEFFRAYDPYNDVAVSARTIEVRGLDTYVSGLQYRSDGTPGNRVRNISIDTESLPSSVLAVVVSKLLS